MSMSTKLEDLPGGTGTGTILEETNQPTQQPPTSSKSNIQVNIKKKVRFDDDNVEEEVEDLDTNKMSFIDMIKTEITEENLLLLAIIFLATMPSVSSSIKSLPFVSQFASSDFTISIATAIVLFLIYIISKLYIIPKLKL
jgi:hypothetical protein